MQSIRELVTDLVQSNKPDKNHYSDGRALGSAPEWDSSKEENFQEWRIKIEAWLEHQNENARKMMEAARALDVSNACETHALHSIGIMRFNGGFLGSVLYA